MHVRRGVGVNDPVTAHLPIFASLGLLSRMRRPARVRLNPRVMGAIALDGALVADGVGVAAATTGARVWDVAAAAVGPSQGFLEELLHRLTPEGGSLLPGTS